MKLNYNIYNYHWWFWSIAVIYASAAIAGWQPGYIYTIEVLALNLLNSILLQNIIAYEKIQVNIIFLLISLGGLWDEGKFYVYICLLTLLVIKTFSCHCIVLYFTRILPWNNRNIRALL